MSETLRRLAAVPGQRTKRALENILGTNWPELTKSLYDVEDKYAPSNAGAGLSPSIWSDCPRGLMLVDPTRGHFVGDDFVQTTGKTFTTAYDYTFAVVGTTPTFTQAASDSNGVAIITTPAEDNAAGNINPAMSVGVVDLKATASWWFETRVKINQITTAQGVFVGLVDDQVTLGSDFIATNTMALKVQGFLGFQILAATDIAAIWRSTHNKASGTQAVLNSTLATASTGWIKLGMKCITNGTVGTITFYVNGVKDTTSVLTSASNFPLDLYGRPAFATKCGSAAANTLSIDWWYAAQLR